MALDVAMILRLVDRFSGPAKRAQAAQKGLTRETGAQGRASAAASRQIERLERNTGRLPRVMDRAGAAARRLGRFSLKALEKGAYGAGWAIGALTRKAAGWAATAAKIGLGAAAAGAGFFAGGILKIGSDFEQFQVILENTEGSAERAKKAMAWVREFAKRTPYEVAQVMEAYVRLRAYGIDPMDGTLKALGNTASGMNKQIIDAVEMLADAQTGEFERLKEFGIRAKVQGDKVAFSYQKNGKDIVKTAKNSGSEIRKALTRIMDERFAGMMDRQSKTLAGLWSNIKDQVAGFQLDVANAGFFDLIKAKVQAFLGWLDAKAKDGSLERWAKRISDRLREMVEWAIKFAEETNWESVGRDLNMIATAAWSMVKAFAMALRIAANLKRVLGTEIKISGFGGFGGGEAPSASAPRKPFAPGSGPGRAPVQWPRTNIPRPAVGKRTAMQLDQRLRIDIGTPTGVSATAKPVSVAPGTKVAIGRNLRGEAMAERFA